MAPKNDSAAPNYRGKKKKHYDQLMALRDQLIDEVRTLSGYSLTTDKQAGEELADVGSDNFLREMEIGLMSEEGRKIELIQEAIERLASGDYGICQGCGEDIGDGRLEALPYAKYCVTCKSKLEQTTGRNGRGGN